jgi:hypothetical protein
MNDEQTNSSPDIAPHRATLSYVTPATNLEHRARDRGRLRLLKLPRTYAIIVASAALLGMDASHDIRVLMMFVVWLAGLGYVVTRMRSSRSGLFIKIQMTVISIALLWYGMELLVGRGYSKLQVICEFGWRSPLVSFQDKLICIADILLLLWFAQVRLADIVLQRRAAARAVVQSSEEGASTS